MLAGFNPFPAHNTMAIPKKFSDEHLRGEIRTLEAELDRLESNKWTLESDLDVANRMLETYKNGFGSHQPPSPSQFRNDGIPLGLVGAVEAYRPVVAKLMEGYNPFTADVEKYQKETSSINEKISKNDRNMANCQAKIEALEKRLKETTPERRAEEHYQSLLRAKNGNPNKEELLELANEFGEMIDYNDDAKARQQECLDLRKKMLYDEMVRRIREWDLSKEVAQDIEDGYRTSANEFRGNLWQGYADTAELARHCDDRARKLKERREEQERKDEEENERLETVERERQQQIEQRRKTAKIIAMVFSVGFCTIVSGLAGRDDPYGPCLFVSLLIFIATVVEIASEGKSFDREFVSGGCALCVIAPFILAGLFSIVYSFISSGTAAAIVLGLLVGGAMGVLIGALISEIIDKYYEKKRGK